MWVCYQGIGVSVSRWRHIVNDNQGIIGNNDSESIFNYFEKFLVSKLDGQYSSG